MLYIKFHITNSDQYTAFEALFDFMVKCRDHTVHFEEPMEEIDINPNDTETRLIKELIPKDALGFLESFAKYDQQYAGAFGFNLEGILNYLIVDFEVDLDQLIRVNASKGIIEFSTGNYPFGGLKRFFITLKAYGLIPYECFNGFAVHDLRWTSDFQYDTQEFPEKTKEYLSQFKS